ncbi:hypothetical protein AX17_004201 [Amanita inopinata Kibby_2008]|nr:hypothetical protein AX17_004201 [Amanita inopinata Kibby_2008]
MLARISLGLFLITTVNAVTPPEALLNRLYEIHPSARKRQTSGRLPHSVSDFPPQCQAGCELMVTAITTCTNANCVCKPTVAKSFQQCINCTVRYIPDADGEEYLYAFNTLCAGYGFTPLSLTVSAVSTSFISPLGGGGGHLTVTLATTTSQGHPLTTPVPGTSMSGGGGGGGGSGDITTRCTSATLGGSTTATIKGISVTISVSGTSMSGSTTTTMEGSVPATTSTSVGRNAGVSMRPGIGAGVGVGYYYCVSAGLGLLAALLVGELV